MHPVAQTASSGLGSDVVFSDNFSFAPFMPMRDGDSGKLQIATSKVDSDLQYIVKSETPELACNEFMYHKIALSLGMHTQEVKLFKGIPKHPYAAGIRYSPRAEKFYLENADETNQRDFYAFEMLYVILNEEDSEEFYIDERQRVFKLDNAASFNLDFFSAQLMLQTSNLTSIAQWRQSRVHLTEYGKYGIILRLLSEKHGAAAQQSALELIERFTIFDETALMDAFATLDASYPSWFSDYYLEFIIIRKATCQRFLQEWLKHNGKQ